FETNLAFGFALPKARALRLRSALKKVHSSLSFRAMRSTAPAAARNRLFPSLTQGSQPRSTLGYSHAVPPKSRHSNLRFSNLESPTRDGTLSLVVALACTPEIRKVPSTSCFPKLPACALDLSCAPESYRWLDC